MFRLTRPLFQAVTKTSTGITGLAVHPNPLPALADTYQRTLSAVATIPSSSVYRQSVEALTQHKLGILSSANGDISHVEKALQEGQIEQSITKAEDELKLVQNMIEWKAWEPLEEKPQPGQWEYAAESHS